jgi:hypothetical protein
MGCNVDGGDRGDHQGDVDPPENAPEGKADVGEVALVVADPNAMPRIAIDQRDGETIRADRSGLSLPRRRQRRSQSGEAAADDHDGVLHFVRNSPDAAS